MNKYLLFICVVVCALCSWTKVIGQSAGTDSSYVRYDEYYRDIGKWLEPWKQDFVHKTLKEIKDGAASLTDDNAPAASLQIARGNRKALSDEDIFSKRRNGVFIVGKLTSSDAKTNRSVNFDLIGTAFVISEDGACVTNYHVLKNIIRPNRTEDKNDSLYFIITADKKIYVIDGILAFSQNNDLAVFKVNMRGGKLYPIPFGKPADTGAPVYCISHPFGHFYYFSKGIVARNISINTLDLGAQYDSSGKPPIRMEITADYTVGSSGGPILDKCGNLIGVVISTTPISAPAKDENGKDISIIQMMVKDTSPVKALTDLLSK
jgi:serine protease Do